LFLNEGTSVLVANWFSSVVSTRIGVVMAFEELWYVSDELWEVVARELPVPARRFRFPGRKRVPDRLCFEGIVFVLRSGLPWRRVPRHDDRPCGVTCWRRFEEWASDGVWDRLHESLVCELGVAGALDLDRAIVDSSQALAKKGANLSAKARSTGAARASNATS
jgi:transposase